VEVDRVGAEEVGEDIERGHSKSSASSSGMIRKSEAYRNATPSQ
jgi:hypothetical protein